MQTPSHTWAVYRAPRRRSEPRQRRPPPNSTSCPGSSMCTTTGEGESPFRIPKAWKTSPAGSLSTGVTAPRGCLPRWSPPLRRRSASGAPSSPLRRRVAWLAAAADEGIIAGIHLAGPSISRARCGAQNPAHIIPGDPALTRDLVDLGRGHVRTMTIAPETPNLEGVLGALVEGGAVPSFGHTDTDEATMREAIAAGVAALAGTGRRATVTHLFNGMRPIHHRPPGPVPAALAAASRGEVIVELIGDGVHLHPGIVRDVFELVGANNIALITDAMAATGMADGEYRLGSLDVVVADGVARLAGGESIAGGTAHLLDVVRTTVAGGVPLVDAVRAAATVPASIIDPAAGFGALEVGKPAQVLRVDEQLRIIDGAA